MKRSWQYLFFALIASACSGVIMKILQSPEVLFTDPAIVAAMCGLISLLVVSLLDKNA